jgi:Reverse transcriptase (RNA-dependent DNA polymerase)
MQRHIDEMLKNDIIRPYVSPWASPALLVNKHDGSTRFVADYRALNAITKFDSYPMPGITDILDQLRNKKYFTCLDLASGYHNVCVSPDSQEKTEFVVENGLYEYKRLSFSLVSAPASLSRLMDHILRRKIRAEGLSFSYLDDVIVTSEETNPHLKDIRKVFDILRTAKLKLNPQKCQFFKEEVVFLGHVITAEGIKPNQ